MERSQRGSGGLYPRYPRVSATLSGDLRAGCAGSDESRRSVAGDRRWSAVVPCSVPEEVVKHGYELLSEPEQQGQDLYFYIRVPGSG